MMTRTLIGVSLLIAGMTATPAIPARGEEIRDLSWFLRRLRTLDHLPEIEPGATALASTWDRTGGANDADDFKQVEGQYNILLDVDGPGCIHRISVAAVGQETAGTRIQFFFDGADTPIVDVSVERLFDDRHGPIPYPLVCRGAYPGMFLPIPYAKHCRIQLYNKEGANWGKNWQIVYTTYPEGTNIRTLTWPFSEGENEEMQAVSERWLEAEKVSPQAPAEWPGEKEVVLASCQTTEVSWPGTGVLRQWRVSCDPQSADLLHRIRLRMYWDGSDQPSVDAPLANFFGYASVGDEIPRYNSLLMGISRADDYCFFPMPFASGGRLSISNNSDQPVKIILRWEVESREALPANWGRFHATHICTPAARPTGPRFGPQRTPVHIALEREGRGKYVGCMLQVLWPWDAWWGEGDWLIWTDGDSWPPRYHGTGTAEYFNASPQQLTRSAVSGFVNAQPPERSAYAFHLNDAFTFEQRIRVAVETTGPPAVQKLLAAHHPYWCSTAFWYAPSAQPASSSPLGLVPSQIPYVKQATATQPATSTAPAGTSLPAG